MRIMIHDRHSFDADRLKSDGWALDVGCRGFEFAKIMQDRGLRVIGMDPDPNVGGKSDKPPLGTIFIRKAVVADGRERAVLANWSTGEGNYVCRDGEEPPHYANGIPVTCISIPEIMREIGVARFEIIKLDCEGDEYPLLEAWPGPIARQISVEFHDPLGRNPCQDDREGWHTRMLAHIGQWYDVAQHERFKFPEMADSLVNYWDSLFVLREGVESA